MLMLLVVQRQHWKNHCLTSSSLFSHYLKIGISRAHFCGPIVRMMVWSLSCPTLVSPWTVARQAPSDHGISRQEHWSGLHFLLQGISLAQESNPCLLHCRQILY